MIGDLMRMAAPKIYRTEEFGPGKSVLIVRP